MRTIEIVNNEINELKERMMSVKGTDTEVYTRIVGYYRAVKNWNKGKRDEYNHRKLFSQPGKPSFREAAETVVSTQRAILPGINTAPADYLYFYRTTCPNCPPVKSWLEDFKLAGTAINVDEKEGYEKAAQYQIFVTPTVVFLDENKKEMYRATNAAALDELFSVIQS